MIIDASEHCKIHDRPQKILTINGVKHYRCEYEEDPCFGPLTTAVSIQGESRAVIQGVNNSSAGLATTGDQVPAARVKTATPQSGRAAAPPSSRDPFLRVPPHNLDAEMALLGAIILDERAIEPALHALRADDFYHEHHRMIFAAMEKLYRSRTPIDVITLGAALGGKDKLERVGGARYLAELAAYVPTAAHTAHHAKLIKEASIKREVAKRAMELIEHSYNGVSADALVGEAERLFKPLSSENSDRLPQLIGADVEVMSAMDFKKSFTDRPARSWIVDGFLARGEISLWSGKVEAGKTTAMRTLAMCVARGIPFLERKTYPSRVLYVMLDSDGPDITFAEFNRLGIDWESDRIDFLIDPVMCLRPNALEQFHQKLQEFKPDLVIVDPLGRFTKFTDITSYETTYAIAEFSELAKRCGCHLVLLHHIPRGRNDDADAATAGFGSVAVAGGCNARFVFVSKPGGIYTIKTSRGKGGGFVPFDEEMRLSRDVETSWVTLEGSFSFKDQARALKPRVLECVQASDEAMTGAQIGQELGIQNSAARLAANMLVEDGEIMRSGSGTKGKPYVFFSRKYAEQTSLSYNRS